MVGEQVLAHPRRIRLAAMVSILLAGALAGSCTKTIAPSKPAPANPGLSPDTKLPDYLRDTIRYHAILTNTAPLEVSSYGLVVDLRHTGNCDCPGAVRDWMTKEMLRHAMGTMRIPGYRNMQPEQVLSDDRAAIVVVEALVPPGARKGDRSDAIVKAIPGNKTTSLSAGLLYVCSLRRDGANPYNPGGSVNEFAAAQGRLLVDPDIAIEKATPNPKVTQSLRTAIIPGGAFLTLDREIILRLREPSYKVAGAIQTRIQEFFQDKTVVKAQDDSQLFLYMPARFHGNWEHFAGIIKNLYLNGSPEFLENRAKVLAKEAVKPNAYLEDISYCLEGMGSIALPALYDLMASRDEDVCFAAARAAAFIGDRLAQETLLNIARSKGHPNRLAALEVLGELPSTPFIQSHLANLLSDPQPEVRIAAYSALVKSGDLHILSQPISSELDPENAFWLDCVDCSGPPLVYVTRVGEPRVAIFGHQVAMNLPAYFTAFDTHLTVSTSAEHPRRLDIYWRPADASQPVVQETSSAQLLDLIGHLGGMGRKGLHFTFGEVVAMLQSMVVSDKLSGVAPGRAQFCLQELPDITRRVYESTGLGAPERPLGDDQATSSGPGLPIVPLGEPTTKNAATQSAATRPHSSRRH